MTSVNVSKRHIYCQKISEKTKKAYFENIKGSFFCEAIVFHVSNQNTTHPDKLGRNMNKIWIKLG